MALFEFKFYGYGFSKVIFRRVYLSLGYLWMGILRLLLVVELDFVVVWYLWYQGLTGMSLEVSSCYSMSEEMLLRYLFFSFSVGSLE